MTLSRSLSSAIVAAVLGAATPVLADNHADLVAAVGDNNHDKHSARIIEKMFTYKLGATCWTKVLDKKNGALGLISGHARGAQDYAELLTGDDWAAIEGQDGDKAKLAETVVGMVDAFAPKFHLTISVEGDDCEPGGRGMWLKYLGTTMSALKKYPPKSGKAFVTINVTAKAKGVKTAVSKDGTKFTITGSRDVEKPAWPDDIEKPIRAVSSKK